MKSMLTAFAALTALALPAGLPTFALAQDEVQAEQAPQNDVGARFQRNEPSGSPVQNYRPERADDQPAQDRRGGGDRGGGRGDRDGVRGDGGRGDRGQDRGDPGGRWNRGDNGGGNGGGGRNRPDQPAAPPVLTLRPPAPPAQDNSGGGGWNRDGDNNGNRGRDRNRGGQEGRAGNGGQDWTRGNEGRDRDGGRNSGRQDDARSQGGAQRVAPRGSFADSCGGSYVNQGRLYADCRDTRGNVRSTSIELGRCSSSDIGNDNGRLVCHNVRGDFEGRRGNNGDRDRDRNNGGRNWNDDRQDRRDYGGFRNRWNQNDWRRDWNRGRSNDWWRNDRGFRGYTGFRNGFYFAPNYGYYAVPRNYFGQRWYQGDYLPSIFWRYSLNDYRTYGLGYPPPGTQWVAVDTTIYLIDSFDGYIIEVIHDAWRW